MEDEIKDEVAEEVIEAAPVAPEVVEEDPAIVEKATKMGWTDKENFKGDPEKWRPAAEFVERGENMLPIMKSKLQRQDRKIADLEKSIKEFAEYHSKTEQRAYEKAMKELKEKQVEAVATADSESFAKIDKEIEELNKRVPAPKIDQTVAADPVYIEWASRNKWVETDEVMLAYAEKKGEQLFKTTTIRGKELLEAVEREVKAKFPDKFVNPRRATAPAVEGAASAAKTSGKTYADMPKDARDSCDRMVKNYGIKKEDFVRTWHEENA